MTKTMEKDIKRKRNFPRGILTPTEREMLKKGDINRQLLFNIRRKTSQTIIVDLPLIFEKIGLEQLMHFAPYKQYLKKTLQLYFRLIEKQIMSERSQRGVKRKVSPKSIWSRMRREIGDM